MTLFDFVHSAHEDVHDLKRDMGAHTAEFRKRVRRQACLKAEQVDRPHDGSHGDVSFKDSVFDAKTFFRLDDVHFSYPDREMFRGIQLDVHRGNRIVVIGQQISSLSMGKRCRVAFVNLYFSNANLLVLDEPTNYLDIERGNDWRRRS